MDTKKRTKDRFTKWDVINRVNAVVAESYGTRRREVEIGERRDQHLHVFATCPTPNEYWEFCDEISDDLDTFSRLRTPEIYDCFRAFGTVVHVYVSVPIPHFRSEYEQDDVLTVWLGTETEPPVLLDGGIARRNGR